MDHPPTTPEDLVLVHGGWHGGWSWQPVAVHLRKAGHKVSAPTSPGLAINDDPRNVTLADCVDSLVDHVEQDHRTGVTLIAHSWGGFVAAGAAPRLAPLLKQIVFWNAFVPRAATPLLDEIPAEYAELLNTSAAESDDNTMSIPIEIFQQAFMGDAAPEASALVYSTLRRQPSRTFTDDPVSGERYQRLGIPLKSVLSSEDTSMPPGMPQRCGATPSFVPGSHESLFTRPAELAAGLMHACATH